MEVILLEKIANLGQMGDVVTVKTGYARNYLLPQKKALRSTKENLAYFESQKAQLAALDAQRKKDAEAAAKALVGCKVSLVRQASEAGQLYGSVTSRDIYDALHADKVRVERNQIDLPQPLKEVGVYEVRIVLHPDVSQVIKVTVARSADESKKLIEKHEADAAKAEKAEKAAKEEAKAAKKAEKEAEQPAEQAQVGKEG
jgi:large subunit ribosomal protein L9